LELLFIHLKTNIQPLHNIVTRKEENLSLIVKTYQLALQPTDRQRGYLNTNPLGAMPTAIESNKVPCAVNLNTLPALA